MHKRNQYQKTQNKNKPFLLFCVSGYVPYCFNLLGLPAKIAFEQGLFNYELFKLEGIDNGICFDSCCCSSFCSSFSNLCLDSYQTTTF